MLIAKSSRYQENPKLRKFTLILMPTSFVLSIALMMFSTWLRTDKEEWIFITKYCSWFESANLFLSAGLSSILVFFIGITGLMVRNRGMLMMFFMVILVCGILKAAGGIAGAACSYRTKDREKQFADAAKNRVYLYGQFGRDYYTAGIDDLQIDNNCCGMEIDTDYEKTAFYTMTSSYPISCCLEEIRGISCGRLRKNVFTQPCFGTFINTYRMFLSEVAAFGIIFAIVDILAGITSLLYMRGLDPLPR